MRFFFRSRGFKIIVAVAAALIAVSVICAFFGSRMSPQADIMGTVTAPFRSAAEKRRTECLKIIIPKVYETYKKSQKRAYLFYEKQD